MKRWSTAIPLQLFIILLLMCVQSSCMAKKHSDSKPIMRLEDKEAKMFKLAKMNTPIFWAEGHPGRLNREKWEIQVTGLCDNPVTLSWDDLHNKLPQSTANGRLTSVTRWSVGGDWSGVKIADLLDYVQAKPTVKYVRFWSYDMVYDTSIPIDIARKDKTLLAWAFDGENLTEDYGGPVRAFVPYLWGYKSAKSVVKIELLDRYIPGYWEKRGYTDSAEIEPGPCRDINDDGKTKQIPGGEVQGFLEDR